MSTAAAPAAKPAAKPRAPRKEPVHPPYAAMVREAIASLKERSGSSLPAITKVQPGDYLTDLNRSRANRPAACRGLPCPADRC